MTATEKERTEARKTWTLPEWMEPHRDLIEADLGGNSIETLMRNTTANGFNNPILAAMIVMGETKVKMLTALKEQGILIQADTTEAAHGTLSVKRVQSDLFEAVVRLRGSKGVAHGATEASSLKKACSNWQHYRGGPRR